MVSLCSKRCTTLPALAAQKRFLAKAATADSNAECQDLTDCDGSESYQAEAPTLTTDRVCAPLSAPCDESGQMESEPPSPTSDRVCVTTTSTTTTTTCAMPGYGQPMSMAMGGDQQVPMAQPISQPPSPPAAGSNWFGAGAASSEAKSE